MMKQYFNAAIQLKAKDNLFKEQQRMAYFTEGKQNNLDVPTVKNSSADRSNNNHNLSSNGSTTYRSIMSNNHSSYNGSSEWDNPLSSKYRAQQMYRPADDQYYIPLKKHKEV